MLNWMAVLRRILRLYNVKTLRELGMAMGIPMRPEDSGPNVPTPWPVLEMVVAEKRVSWDWLLTGKESGGRPGDGDEEGKPSVPASQPSQSPPPRLETRELARTLLAPRQDADEWGEDIEPEAPEPSAPEPPSASRGDAEAVIRELKELKTSIQKEMDRVDAILGEHGDSP